jgi:hypothetical protein
VDRDEAGTDIGSVAIFSGLKSSTICMLLVV